VIGISFGPNGSVIVYSSLSNISVSSRGLPLSSQLWISGILNNYLRDFLESSVSKNKKDVKLGVAEGNLKTAIETALGISCVKDSTVQELTRAIRLHFSTYLQSLNKDSDEKKDEKDDFLFKAERGLAHSYGRAKIKFNVNRSDNMIIQSISILDQLDKDVNTFAMRLREWYSWHFPELVKIVNDNILYARCAIAIGNREQIDEASCVCCNGSCCDCTN